MTVKRYNFATWLRAVAVIMILSCHFVIESSNTVLNMSAQFFNIGVDLFIILSGFLFGTQGEIKQAWAWYGKRLSCLSSF